MRTIRRLATAVGIAAAAATAVTAAPAHAESTPMPVGSPVPVPDGDPFALPGGLSPTTDEVLRGIAWTPTPGAQLDLLPRVATVGGQPALVARLVDPQDGAPVGGEVVVSDAASLPVGDDAPVAVGFVSPPPVVCSPATPPEPGRPAQPAPPCPRPEPGSWLVAWAAQHEGAERVMARRLAVTGEPVGAPFALSDVAYADVGDVAVAVEDLNRRAVAVWSGRRADAQNHELTTQGWQPEQGLVAPSGERISSPAGDVRGSVSIRYNVFQSARHLVAWRGTDPDAVGPGDEEEILGRVLSQAGGAPASGVVRLSRVGTDGDPDARPLAFAVTPAFALPRAAAWAVAWTQSAGAPAAVRVLGADAAGAPAHDVAPADLAPGERLGGVAIAAFGDGGYGLAYDAGPVDGTRRVSLQRLDAGGAATGASVALSAPDQDARTPRFAEQPYFCNKLILWNVGPGTAAAGRRAWESNCQHIAPAPDLAHRPELDPPAEGTPRPAAPRLRGARLVAARVPAGRAVRVRLRVTAPARLVARIERPARRRRGARARGGARSGAALATRRATIRRAGAVELRVATRDRRGRRLAPGRYVLVVAATARASRVVSSTARLPFRVVARR